MNYIQTLTSDPRQQFTAVLPDGSQVTIFLEYKAQQLGWFYSSISWGDFLVQGMRVAANPNALHQFKNQIPFGIGVFVSDNQEPTLVTDFISGRAKMAILTQAEVAAWAEYLSGGQVPA